MLKSFYLNSLLAYSRIFVDFATFLADFKPAKSFDMVFVHVSRCLIFKVQPRPFRERFDIIARKPTNVKHYFCSFSTFFRN